MAEDEEVPRDAEADGDATTSGEDTAPDDAPKTAPDDVPEPPPEPVARRGRGFNGVLAALLVGLLGFTIAVQIRSHGEEALDGARTEDLVRILADLDAQRSRLSDDIAELRQTRDELASGSEGNKAALERAEELADSVGILAGTLAATGPGIVLTFVPGDDPIRAAVMLDAVQELRGAGAEAMQLVGANGSKVRIIASSYFAESGENLVVDAVTLAPAYTLTAIGDPETMATALRIPGGVEDTVKKDGGTVIVRQPGTVEVTALAQVADPEYAEPVD
ncbi:uncharacterized protein YlxW (UPF0749 family) [Stackebrandtia albiflava]|uniref:Uncharacterized protein YlxW (UPF0749 family) n=1 Tax=Stackebrandtia albiflava TaxID=406432 RepID=A0A562VDA7_9ACTN|nr:DUF881 domain-containing protein [Stackebrandtia albiflava]TWJ15852.1 uncharacterized protein YlxW (UPF0749 family) [Stackebrandtia albiflava]